MHLPYKTKFFFRSSAFDWWLYLLLQPSAYSVKNKADSTWIAKSVLCLIFYHRGLFVLSAQYGAVQSICGVFLWKRAYRFNRPFDILVGVRIGNKHCFKLRGSCVNPAVQQMTVKPRVFLGVAASRFIIAFYRFIDEIIISQTNEIFNKKTAKPP